MFSVFDISGRAMSAQLVRLNAIASNLANAGGIAAKPESAFRALKPVFQSIEDGAGRATVAIASVGPTGVQPVKRYDPGHPLADKEGFVYEAAVDPNQELVEMVETARQYQNDVEVLNTAKSLILNTLKMGQS